MCGGLRWGFLHVFSFCLSASIAYDRIAVARIRFDFSPQIVMITIHEINSASSQPLISGPWIRGMSKGRLIVQPVAYSNDNYVNLTWNGNALSFYSTKDANYQLNLKDGIYHFFAIG